MQRQKLPTNIWWNWPLTEIDRRSQFHQHFMCSKDPRVKYWWNWSQVIVHPHFRNLSHDLALLKVDRNIKFDWENISPICLPFTGMFPDLDKVCQLWRHFKNLFTTLFFINDVTNLIIISYYLFPYLTSLVSRSYLLMYAYLQVNVKFIMPLVAFSQTVTSFF